MHDIRLNLHAQFEFIETYLAMRLRLITHNMKNWVLIRLRFSQIQFCEDEIIHLWKVIFCEAEMILPNTFLWVLLMCHQMFYHVHWEWMSESGWVFCWVCEANGVLWVNDDIFVLCCAVNLIRIPIVICARVNDFVFVLLHNINQIIQFVNFHHSFTHSSFITKVFFT